MHHRLSTILLLAGLATERASAAIPNLTACQTRCYDMTAQLVGCGTEDYACQCPIFSEQFIPQMQSCMIEGCAFDNEPLNTTQLQSSVCALAGGQSPAPTSGSPSGSEPQPTQTPSPTSPGSSESPGTDTLPSTPSTTTTSSPESTSGSHGGGAGSTNSPEPGGEEGVASALRVLDAGLVTGILAVLAGVYFF